MAPVELLCLTRIVTQRQLGRVRFLLRPHGRVSPDGIISSGAECLKDTYAGQSLALGLPCARRQHLVEPVFPETDHRLRLNGPLVDEFCRTRRITLRTFRKTRSSRQVCLID